MDESNAGFLGRGWTFPPRVNEYSDETITVEAEADIAESLRILMSTWRGERIMQPEYGCWSQSQKFETTDVAGIEAAIRDAVLFFEPRATLHSVTVLFDDCIAGKMTIKLDYTVSQTNNRAHVVFPFYCEEGTLVSKTPRLAVQDDS